MGGRGISAIVPLRRDDPTAPGGCAALRTVAGVPLVVSAARMLRRSGRVDRLVVPVPPELAARVEALLAAPSAGEAAGTEAGSLAEEPAAEETGPVAEVVPVPEDDLGACVVAALSTIEATDDAAIVVVDPLHPLAPVDLVGTVLDTLARAPEEVGCVVPVRAVTDTLKWVDEDDTVVATADRAAFRAVATPQAFRAGPLRAAGGGGAAGSEPGEAVVVCLPRLVRAAGGRVMSVVVAGEDVRVAGEDHVLLAEALREGDTDAPPGSAPR